MEKYIEELYKKDLNDRDNHDDVITHLVTDILAPKVHSLHYSSLLILHILWICTNVFRDTKGTFHAKMGTIKVRNAMDLTEVEDIKKRLQEYTELYKKSGYAR